MKVIFFGSSDFAVPAFRALEEKEEVILAVTQPDRKKGRSLKLDSTPVKKAADKSGVKSFQPDDVNSKEAVCYLRGFGADIFVVVSFGQILRKEVLDLPAAYPLNVHSSLLPKYRGAAPINWAIANGEKKTGVSVIKMNEKMDQGDIILKKAVPIAGNEDAIRLSERLSAEGADVLLESIELIKKDRVSLAKQNEAEATYAPRLKKEDGLIDWKLSSGEIYNRVRAFVPWPGCFTYWDKNILKIWRAETETLSGQTEDAGTVLDCSDRGILVMTGNNGGLRIKELQIAGKRRMSAPQFIAGHRGIKPGSRL